MGERHSSVVVVLRVHRWKESIAEQQQSRGQVRRRQRLHVEFRLVHCQLILREIPDFVQSINNCMQPSCILRLDNRPVRSEEMVVL